VNQAIGPAIHIGGPAGARLQRIDTDGIRLPRLQCYVAARRFVIEGVSGTGLTS
jgi:hypothetical protein